MDEVNADVVHYSRRTTIELPADALEIFLLSRGTLTTLQEPLVRARADDVLFVMHDRPSLLGAAASTTAVRYAIGGALRERLRAHLPGHPFCLPADSVRDILTRLRAELRRADAAAALAVEGALCELVARAARLLRRGTLSEPVAAALRYLDEHIGERVTVQDLAIAAGLSVRAITARFKAELMAPPLEYVRRVRLAGAARALSEENVSLAEIANRYGFYDHAHFSRLFRQFYGVTPSEYRQVEFDVSQQRRVQTCRPVLTESSASSRY
jgi:AraC-like DNA-binding protein